MPTVAGFILFLRNICGIPTTVLPDNSPTIPYAFAYAQSVVSDYLAMVSPDPYSLYSDAVYNLATHILIENAQDQPGAQITGRIAGNNLTVVAVISGALVQGQTLLATGLVTPTTIISGASLAWEVNPAQSYGSVATPFTINSQFTYFSDLRDLWKLNNFVAGVVQTTSDENTSTTLKVAEVMERLMFSDLDYLKTPFGRKYLSLANRVGTPFGMA
jgi:hypothetical protein